MCVKGSGLSTLYSTGGFGDVTIRGEIPTDEEPHLIMVYGVCNFFTDRCVLDIVIERANKKARTESRARLLSEAFKNLRRYAAASPIQVEQCMRGEVLKERLAGQCERRCL